MGVDRWPHPLRTALATFPPPGPGPLVVGVSGGLDSVLLLDGLARLAGESGWDLTVAHLDHALRPESDADARFVDALARRLDCRAVVDRLPKGWSRERQGESVEMAARRHRHRFLARVARGVGARHVALAHHADDQAELLLLRLLRGAGSDGLGGLHPIAPSPADPGILLLRPLLAMPRETLAHHARAIGLEWREDPSNADPAHLRNRVRHEVLPFLAGIGGPGLAERLARTARILGDEATWIAEEADRWLRAARPRAFGRLPVALQRAVLREQLWRLGVQATWERVERLRLHPESSLNPSPGLCVERTRDGRLEAAPTPDRTWIPDEVRVTLADPGGSVAFGGATIRWNRRPSTGRRPSSRPGREKLDASAVGREIVLRHWRPGDRFQPLGMPRPARLQDLWVNRKIPRAERFRRVVATTADGRLFWVEGLPPGEDFRIRAGTRQRLDWFWIRPEPAVPED